MRYAQSNAYQDWFVLKKDSPLLKTFFRVVSVASLRYAGTNPYAPLRGLRFAQVFSFPYPVLILVFLGVTLERIPYPHPEPPFPPF